MNITINGDCYAPTQPSSKTQGWVGLNKKKATLSSCLLRVDRYDIQIEINRKEKVSLRGAELRGYLKEGRVAGYSYSSLETEFKTVFKTVFKRGQIGRACLAYVQN